MKALTQGLVLAGLLWLPGMARADRMAPLDLVDPKVPYHGTMALDVGRDAFSGPIEHLPSRLRWDVRWRGDAYDLILRRDSDQVMVLWPSTRWVMTSSIATAAAFVGGIDRFALDVIRDGQETVGDEPCTRYQVTSRDFNGRVWLTRDGVMVRMRGTAKQGERTAPLTMRLDGLVRGAVDAAEFEAPQGWFAIPLDTFMKKGD